MATLISEELADSLCEQIGHEKYNANLYLFIAGYLKNKGLNNLASHFEKQHDEETEHSKMVYGILTDLNAEVRIPEIGEIKGGFNTILDIAQAYLEREILTTESLNSIKKMAIELDDAVVEEAMRKMIALQQNEYEEATDFEDKAILTGGDWKWVFMWDSGLNS